MVAKAHKLNAEIKGVVVGSGPEEAAVKKMIKPYSFIKMKKPYSSKAQLYSTIGKSMAFGISSTFLTIESSFTSLGIGV